MGQKRVEPLDSKRSSLEELSECLRAIESKVDGLAPHILQLENAAILIIGLIVLLQVLGTLWLSQPKTEIAQLYWFIPYATLFLVGRVIKIRNPYNRVAEVVETGFNYAGAGALVGGSITGLLSGGLGAPAGGAIGGGVGFVVGVFAGIFKARGKEKNRSSERVLCQSCEHQIRVADRFCEKCGREQASINTSCPKCSTKLGPHARFCPNCGEAQSREERTPPAGGGTPSITESQETSQDSAATGTQAHAERQNLSWAPGGSSISTARFIHLADLDKDLEEPAAEERANTDPIGADENKPSD